MGGEGDLYIGRGVMVIDQERCQPETPNTGPGYPFDVRIHTHSRVILFRFPLADVLYIYTYTYITAAREPTN